MWTVRGLEDLPLFGVPAKSHYKWQLNLTPANLGQGFIIHTRYVLSQLAGAALASGFLLPLALANEGTWFKMGASGFQGKDTSCVHTYV